MRILAFVILVVVATSTGCTRKTTIQAGEVGVSSGNPTAAPINDGRVAGQGRTSGSNSVDLVNLSQVIKIFEATEGRAPTNLVELVGMGYLTNLPTPPTGMRFSYDPSTALVNIVPDQ